MGVVITPLVLALATLINQGNAPMGLDGWIQTTGNLCKSRRSSCSDVMAILTEQDLPTTKPTPCRHRTPRISSIQGAELMRLQGFENIPFLGKMLQHFRQGIQHIGFCFYAVVKNNNRSFSSISDHVL